jgi:agmatinase
VQLSTEKITICQILTGEGESLLTGPIGNTMVLEDSGNHREDQMTDQNQPDSIAVLGVPFDANSSFLKGTALAPPLIREALHSYSSNLCTESGLDLADDKRWSEVGDVEISDNKRAFDQIEAATTGLLDENTRVIALGGDHSITVPLMRAHHKKYGKLNVLHLDAHPDLYDELDGNRYSHATPFLRCLEEGLIGRLVQVGIRTATTAQRRNAEQYNVEMIEMRDWHRGLKFDLEAPFYLSLDIDCLDPAFAPGVSHHEPGGLTTREVLKIIQELPAPPVGVDLVEFNPTRDPQGITAMTAAKLLRELIGRMLA